MTNKGYFHRVSALSPTKLWINNVTVEEARTAIDAGAVGCTQNPTYTWRILSKSSEATHAADIARGLLQATKDDNEVVIRLQRQLVFAVAQVFLPLWESSGGKLGYVSIQGDPFQEEEDAIIEHARASRKGGPPNIMCKIPATANGMKAIEVLAAEGVPLNATEVMAVRQALDVCETWAKAVSKMDNPPPSYYSHIAGIYDEYLKDYVVRHSIDVSADALAQAGLAVARKCYCMTKSRWPDMGFIAGGARGLHHFTEMVGADVCITINWAGTADKLIERDEPVVWRFYNPIADYVLDELLQKVEDFRRAWQVNAIESEEYEKFGPVVYFRKVFEQAWDSARKRIGELRAQM